MKTQSTVADLLTRVAGRDEKAYDQLRRRLTPHLFAWVRAVVGNSKVSRQILDEVWASFHREARSLSQARRSPEVWLVLQARARGVDWMRTCRGVMPQALARLQSLPTDASWLPDLEDAASLDERHRLLSKVLGQLPPSQARLLDWAVCMGLSEAEIAQRLGEPEGKVQSELRAAFRFVRHRLRAMMGAWTAGI